MAESVPSPLAIDQLLRDRVTEAVIAQGGFRHEQLNAFLRKRLAGRDIENGALFSEPAIEGAAGYVSSGKTPEDLSGNPIHPDVVRALMSGEPGDDYRFDYPAYAHQITAWELLTAQEPNSVLVSSGTGSGKTECFLVPLLDDLAREAEKSGRLTGVRAIMLYPLNALIASQEERLRRWTQPFGGTIRFALYNGLMQDKRKSDRDKAEGSVPEQVLYRTTLRKDPPPILVTNNTMLEYMTIRKEDAPIVEQSQGQLRWIVIDEAHSYIGSAAAEVSLLLRRVLQTFGVAAKNVRFVATSATIGGSDDKARAELKRYLADLAGIPQEQAHVVIGKRQDVALPPAGKPAPLSSADLKDGAAFASNPAVQALVRAAERGAVPLEAIARHAKPTGIAPTELIEAIAAKRSRVGDGQAAPLLPLRVHKFVRAVPGLWSCLNPDCAGDKPDDWPFGALLFERTDVCAHCRAPVFELVTCRECGEPWLAAFDHGDRLTPVKSEPDRDEFAAASARDDDGADDDEDGGNAAASGASPRPDGVRRLIATRGLTTLNETAVDPLSGALPEKRSAGKPIWISKPVNDGACPNCHSAPSKHGASPLWPFRFGAPFLIQNAAPTMLDGVTPSGRSNLELPAQGRQLLSFTDSRQGTARFAANIETMSERNYVRAFVYHMAQKAAVGPAIEPEERARLENQLATLRPLAAANPTIADMVADIQRQLSGTDATDASVTWGNAVRALASDPMVSQWIRSVWEDRDPRFRNDPEAFARFLLLRELARRPRRANAIETLGFAKLVFTDIEKLREFNLPHPLKRKGQNIEAWKAFLYYLIDTSIRSGFVLYISREDARWLPSRYAITKNVVGPGEDRRQTSDLTWPAARAGGNKTNAVRILETALNLDSGDSQDRAEINDTLCVAWTQLRPLLEGPGSTYALNFEKASIAAVREAWLCPVTHRVLPRLVFGRTPYSVRSNSPAALDKPKQISFPQLPITFPRSNDDHAALSDFAEQDAQIAGLRAQGVWRDFHDRAATFAPYIRAEEHSAQQPPHRLRGFEREFRDGKINILACSTTMEMGVDIGSVEAVLNTNVPPSISNYRQRVGRAGRRNQSFSSSLTLARGTPLDREAFRDPVRYLSRSLRSPQVKLDSVRIVQRHANALLLAHWFRLAEGQLTKVKTGEFFGYPPDLKQEPLENPPVTQFVEWLADPSTHKTMTGPIGTLTIGTALHNNTHILEVAASGFREAAGAFGSQWKRLEEQATLASPDARKSIDLQAKRMCREPLLKELANRSLLPGHGFPTAVLQFINDCKESRARQPQDDEPEANRNRRYDYPSRNADIAIREYAPGAEVVIDGLVWTSAGVTLNWRRPAHDADAHEIQSLRWFWNCRECGEAGCSQTRDDRCGTCGAGLSEQLHFLEPSGFRIDWSSGPHAETDRVTYIEPEPARVSARNAYWAPLYDPTLGRWRATSDGLVFHASRGARKQGYRICLDCGRAAEDNPDGTSGLADHDALVPQQGGDRRCSGNAKSYAVTNALALGHEVLTDVAELQPAALSDPGASWALLSALREALSRRLGIEPRELGLAVEKRRGLLGQSTHSLFLFDQSSGGAGYAPRLFDDLATLLADARDILNCPAGCERGCSACVLTADLFAHQAIIDRNAALGFVDGLLAAIAEPQAEDIAGSRAMLSPPAADALKRRMASEDAVWIYASGGFDLAALSEAPLSSLFASAARIGAEMRLVLPDEDFRQMDDAVRRGLRNASHRHRFTVWTGARDTAPNGATLIAVLAGKTGCSGFFTRDLNAGVLGHDWGVGLKHPVVTVLLDATPEAMPVPEDALERTIKPGDRVKIISADSGRSAVQFGAGFVRTLLKGELEAAGLWKPGALTELSYSDRYIKAPLPALLMMRVVAALKDALAAKGTPIPLTIVTEPLRAEHYERSPVRLGHNWQNENVREETIMAMALGLRFSRCAYRNGVAPHWRKLSIRYNDGSEAAILLDQGFGYWRASANDRHDFRAGSAAQARALLESGVFVAGAGESYLVVTSDRQEGGGSCSGSLSSLT